MEREIEFRGLLSGGLGWVYGDLIRNGNRRVISVQYSSCVDDFECYEVIPETVGQYAGLLDVDGKRIYEGDYLFVCSGYTSTVDFQDGMFVSIYMHPEDGEIIPLFDAIGKDTKIIGNIHKNE